MRGTYLETDRAGGSIPANETTGGQKRRDLPIVMCDEHAEALSAGLLTPVVLMCIVQPVATSAQPQFEWCSGHIG